LLPVELPASLRGSEVPETGLIVTALEAGSPAEKAGMLVGDVLLGTEGRYDDPESLLEAIGRAGDSVRLRLLRGGKISLLDVDLGTSGRAA
jgi:S1-C subfamily serine protease